ncbi:putative lipoprotein [Cystobacter fuscus DSM 2262]|uniref:Lipoprotein n=1 Tax=Cystobacter fuscus (strain ATCC 25194 / DSM 2262 / NBRC 100088 / M29) TaxID=1242864 RepID=S9P3W9_CYSF2|nr:hypothetical protein [Cystobacter fuscus]EPX57871.1 putative lipoprotein [Cystobacter fuscus DSM 2262]
MSPRPFLSSLLGATLALGCGAPSDTGLGLELRMSQAVASEVGAFQVVVLREGRERRCADLQRTCVQQQVKSDELVVIQGPDGKKGRALRFSAALSDVGTQEMSADIPVGRDYVVIIEALSRANPPRFLGSSCNYLDSVSATRNEPLIAAAITLTAAECDPTIAP